LALRAAWAHALAGGAGDAPGGARLITLVVGLLAAPVVAGIALFAVSEREPLVRESLAVTSAEKRRLYVLLRRKNPKTLVPGETRTLTLASRDLDLLLAWGLPVVLNDGRARARIDLESPAYGRPVAVAPLAWRYSLSESRGRRAGGDRQRRAWLRHRTGISQLMLEP